MKEATITSSEVLATLKKLGKPQTAAIYKRYGTGDNVFGVLTTIVFAASASLIESGSAVNRIPRIP